MKKKNKEIVHTDCNYLLLVKLPDKSIHQVLISQDVIKEMISNSGKFRVVEEEVVGIDFDKN